MQICSDPLEAVRSVGVDHQWCVTLPACYPTIIPYIPTNIEYNDQKAFNTRASSFDVNNYDCTNILDSSLCANSQLIQRIRRKIDLYQTPSSNDAHERFQRSTDIVKQRVAHGDVRERINHSHQPKSNIQHDVLPVSSSVTSKSRSPSLLHQAVNRKITDERVSTKDSSYQSDSSDSSFHSTNSSTSSNQTNDSTSQFSSTQSVQSSSEDSESNFDEIDSKSSKIFGPSPIDHNDRAPMVMDNSVSSISSTPHFLKQQVVTDRLDLRQKVYNMMTSSNHPGNSAMTVSPSNVTVHDLNNDRIISAIDLSTIQSPTSYITYFGQQELLTPSSTSAYSHRSPSIKRQYSTQVEHTFVKFNENIDRHGRKKDYQHRLSKEIHDNKIKKQNSWFEKLTKKRLRKHLNKTSFHDSSPENTSSMYINDRKRLDRLDHLDMREAMTALELDLTKEAFQALINKKKDSQQNRLMHILTVPSCCCRSCRTQRCLATVAQHSIDFAVKKLCKYLQLIN